MHSTVTTAGPLLWVLLALGVLACGLAVLLAVDAARRPASTFRTLPETRWPYIAIGATYALAYVAWWFAAVRTAAPWVGHIVFFGLLVLALAGAAYLLRVVYPKQPVRESPASPARAEDPERHEEP